MTYNAGNAKWTLGDTQFSISNFKLSTGTTGNPQRSAGKQIHWPFGAIRRSTSFYLSARPRKDSAKGWLWTRRATPLSGSPKRSKLQFFTGMQTTQTSPIQPVLAMLNFFLAKLNLVLKILDEVLQYNISDRQANIAIFPGHEHQKVQSFRKAWETQGLHKDRYFGP